MAKRIFWAGDSTVKQNFYMSFPQTGMGQAFGLYLKRTYRVENYSENGRSTKSFIDEGRLDLIDQAIGAGDYLFIQFGHNDEKPDPKRGTKSFGDYQENLKKMVDVARSHGAYPLLITPLYRRVFEEDHKTLKEGTHLDYPDAMIALAKELDVPVVDLTTLSKKKIEEAGFEKSKDWFVHVPAGEYPNFPDGKEDNTHLKYEGAYVFSGLVAEELKKIGGVYGEMLVDPESDLEDPSLLVDFHGDNKVQ
ncbi:MAG: rhamnogalacturonan acetylesterase [Lachnospiraceae bacterium]|nr:rhamnogalacturonan acetylesterase [Lachnospiraceae bacterium]